MKLKPLLARLQSTLEHDHNVEPIVLLSESGATTIPSTSAKNSASSDINLIAAHNGSPNSQVALDLALWMAHRTRLASQRNVTVHVIYVIDPLDDRSARSVNQHLSSHHADQRDHARPQWTSRSTHQALLDFSPTISSTSRLPGQTQGATDERIQTKLPTIRTQHNPFTSLAAWKEVEPSLTRRLQAADRVLWQARSLAEEWHGALETHLRFGELAIELRKVAQYVAADALLLGCHTSDHPLVQQLAIHPPCTVLGIPAQLNG